MKQFFKLLLMIFIYKLSLISAKSTEVPPSLVTDLSKKIISINVNFSGSKFHIFGAIKKYASQVSPIDQPPFDIVIEVIGPPVAMNMFKKEKKYGFWVNKKIQTFESIPSFYSISGTKPLEDLLPITAQRVNEIGIFEHFNSKDGKLKKELIEEILSIGRFKQQYYESNTPITLLENTLFSNEIDFPTNLYEGNYKVKIHLIRFEEVLATKQDIIYVKKIGVQNWINYLAYQEPKLYGIACIIIAVSFGFGASVVFRKKV